jgi:uncharacterized protein YozE (UPF0346 family)
LNWYKIHNFPQHAANNFSQTVPPTGWLLRRNHNISCYNDSIWLNLTQFDSIWINLTQFDSIWLNLTQFDSIWLNLTQFDSIWLNLTQFDSIWLNLTQFDSIWLNLTQFEDNFGAVKGQKRAVILKKSSHEGSEGPGNPALILTAS